MWGTRRVANRGGKFQPPRARLITWGLHSHATYLSLTFSLRMMMSPLLGLGGPSLKWKEIMCMHAGLGLPLALCLRQAFGLGGPSLRWKEITCTQGLAAIGTLLKASASDKWWRGSKIKHLELTGDGLGLAPSQWGERYMAHINGELPTLGTGECPACCSRKVGSFFRVDSLPGVVSRMDSLSGLEPCPGSNAF